ncbi:hypothetical protein M0811_12589 [Anaeramoeba ignava]|uniref:SGNH hydrolase-type esterase domain-containing protein n=1 Tax=Anaeramoeba ignava TaxID=1746090 RepID=A0A9Q0R6W2_ANAIG|nr:hypothetical protein M0811_12589 [Anaeramoeba ignava]
MGNHQKIKILAMGDSLTKGYTNHGQTHNPYTLKLSEYLNKKFKKIKFEIENKGISGEQCKDMPIRFEKIMSENDYHFVIILGGTNDLAYGRSHEDILKDIINLHQIALSSKNLVKSIAVSIPQCLFDERNEKIFEIKKIVNKEIFNFSQKEEKVEFFDLFNLIPFSLSEKELMSFWDKDGLHFSSLGYDHFGKLLFDFLEEIIFNYLEKLKKEK